MNPYKYAIITPAYNEARFLPGVIRSIAGQQIKPVKWVIVDDRSSDDTWEIITSEARKHPFITPLQVTGDKARRVGANVVRVFNQGLKTLEEPVDFIVKMDADVELPLNYFSFLLETFRADEKLGMASGKTYVKLDGEWVLERCPDFHVVGPCKMYRKVCFDETGGLYPLLGWDILDGAKARSKGWTTRSFGDLPVYHQRLMGSAKGMIKGRLRTGRVMYTIHAHPLFVLGKSLFRVIEKPYFASLMIPMGYLLSHFTRPERLNDPELVAFLRKEQTTRLTGKTRKQESFIPKRLKDSPDHTGETS